MHAPMSDPSPWVARFAPLIAAGEVLDLACGGGRHARHLAALGHPVLALDRDAGALALAAGPGITTVEADLELTGAAWPFGAGRFAGIVVTHYLHRPLLAQLAASLRPDGVLIYETFAAGNEAFGKPSNPDFLLARGELLAFALAAGLRVIAFEDGRVDALKHGPQQRKPAMLQRLCAGGPNFSANNAMLGPV